MTTRYYADHSFHLEGQYGASVPKPFSKEFGGWGTWQVQDGFLCTTQTNSMTRDTLPIKDKIRILSLTADRLTYRGAESGIVRTETRKP